MENNKKINMELDASQVPYLLGAIRLGIWVNDWCAALSYSVRRTVDTRAGRSISHMTQIIDQIKQQTSISHEMKPDAHSFAMKQIVDLISKECKKFEENPSYLWEEDYIPF